MSSLPRKNRVLAALQKDARRLKAPPAEGYNIPVGSEEVPKIFEKAREVHQHNIIKHLCMVIYDDESCDAVCLFCGRKTQIRKPYTTDIDNQTFLVFKQFHVSCESPKNPVGFFNVDEATVPRVNPRYVNGTVEVELVEVVQNPKTKYEEYRFYDIKDPTVMLRMEAIKFNELFKAKEA